MVFQFVQRSNFYKLSPLFTFRYNSPNRDSSVEKQINNKMFYILRTSNLLKIYSIQSNYIFRD